MSSHAHLFGRDAGGTFQIASKKINFAGVVTINGKPLGSSGGSSGPAVNIAEELQQLRQCYYNPAASVNKGSSSNSYNFATKDCGGGSTLWHKMKCAISLKAASATGADEDWRLFNDPPRVAW